MTLTQALSQPAGQLGQHRHGPAQPATGVAGPGQRGAPVRPGARRPDPVPRRARRSGLARRSPAELGQLASAAAAIPGRWRAALQFGRDRRWYDRLELADDYEIWLISWLPGQETGFHDHGDANGAFAVAQGELRERTAAVGRPGVSSRVLRAGEFRSFGRRHAHDVGNVSAAPAVSVHAYSPPLTLMRRYRLAGCGLVLTSTEAAGQSW